MLHHNINEAPEYLRAALFSPAFIDNLNLDNGGYQILGYLYISKCNITVLLKSVIQ